MFEPRIYTEAKRRLSPTQKQIYNRRNGVCVQFLSWRKFPTEFLMINEVEKYSQSETMPRRTCFETRVFTRARGVRFWRPQKLFDSNEMKRKQRNGLSNFNSSRDCYKNFRFFEERGEVVLEVDTTQPGRNSGS